MLKKLSVISIFFFLLWINLYAQNADQVKDAQYSLGFSTYLSHIDLYGANFDVFADELGNTYVSGNTRDKNFPVTKNAYQKELKGEADAFVSKFDSEGKLVYSTLIGGSKREHHTGITVDKNGCVYIIGGTHSADFPVTAGSYDTSFNGEGEWAGDVFLAKINPGGSSIEFSTFIGGNTEETATSVRLDSKNNIIIGGTTCSADFPVTTKEFNDSVKSQVSFLAKFNPDASQLLFSTTLGSRMDMIIEVVSDNNDDIYFTGYTVSDDLPVTEGAIRKEFIMPKGGFEEGYDHFFGKIKSDGSDLLYLSYLGAAGHGGSHITYFPPDKLMVTGSTKSEVFPLTEDAYSKKLGGDRDNYISIFNSETMQLEYSTFLGGNGADHVVSAAFIDERTIVIGGKTNSSDYPLSDDALYSEYPVWDKSFNSTFFGKRKSFITIFDIEKSEILYSTYLGNCIQFRVSPDNQGNVSFVGEVGQRFYGEGMTDFPVTQNAFQEFPTFLVTGRLLITNGKIAE